MTTIALPDELEQRLAEEAARQGVSLEQLALEWLDQRVPRRSAGTLYDRLKPYIGAVDSRNGSAAPASARDDFAAYLDEKHPREASE